MKASLHASTTVEVLELEVEIYSKQHELPIALVIKTIPKCFTKAVKQQYS